MILAAYGGPVDPCLHDAGALEVMERQDSAARVGWRWRRDGAILRFLLVGVRPASSALPGWQ